LQQPEEYQGLRFIVLFQANDAGQFDDIADTTFRFYGSSLLKLKTEVGQLQQHLLGLPGRHNSLCVRAGSYGRLTPLVTDLPHSDESMDIIVLTDRPPAADALRYSSLEEA
jgi:hypothetical protein